MFLWVKIVAHVKHSLSGLVLRAGLSVVCRSCCCCCCWYCLGDCSLLLYGLLFVGWALFRCSFQSYRVEVLCIEKWVVYPACSCCIILLIVVRLGGRTALSLVLHFSFVFKYLDIFTKVIALWLWLWGFCGYGSLFVFCKILEIRHLSLRRAKSSRKATPNTNEQFTKPTTIFKHTKQTKIRRWKITNRWEKLAELFGSKRTKLFATAKQKQMIFAAEWPWFCAKFRIFLTYLSTPTISLGQVNPH